MYENYLYSLNEMYYGKHSYFKIIENLFEKFKQFIKKHEEEKNNIVINSVPTINNVIKNNPNVLSKSLPKMEKLRSNRKRLNEGEELDAEMIEKAVKYLDNKYFDTNSMEDLYKQFNAQVLSDQLDTYGVKKKDMHLDFKSILVFAQQAMPGVKYFIPNSLEEAKEYDRITQEISKYFVKIFNLPNMRIILMTESPMPQAVYLFSELYTKIGEFDFSKGKGI